MKRTSRQAASKSGTPVKNKPKRVKYDAQQVAKKIQKWRSASAVAETKTPIHASNFVDRLWLKVDKSDPEAVRKVLELHAHGKGGEEDAVYFASSRFWYIYKLLQDERLSYFSLSLWSVRLEAASLAGDSIIIGDENCALVHINKPRNSTNIHRVLKNCDTLHLVNWYETYYNLAFGHTSLTDNTELTRNTTTTFNHSQNSDEAVFLERYNQDISIEVQPPDETDQNLEQTVDNLRTQLDATRPRFLYAEKDEIEQSNVGDRIIVVLNVMSDVDYVPPLGWSFQPFTYTPSICIPLEIFEGLNVYDQITLAQRFLTFTGDRLVDNQDVGLDTRDLIKLTSTQSQTDPVLKSELHSPPLNFNHNFEPTADHYPVNGHICRCMPCNNFLFEFLQEWGMHHGLLAQLEQPRINNDMPTDFCFSEVIGGAGDSDFNNNFINTGGNFMHFSCTPHTITETKTRKRNIDLDRLSQSSPDVESASSSSSSSSTALGGETKIPIKQTLPPQPNPEEPVIIIDEEDVPTIVSKVPIGTPQSPKIIILDDEGNQPIINLASSPIIVKHPVPTVKEIKTKMLKDTSSYFTPPQASQSTDEFIKQFYFDNVGVGLERINLDLILQRTTWGGADMMYWRRLGWDSIIEFPQHRLQL